MGAEHRRDRHDERAAIKAEVLAELKAEANEILIVRHGLNPNFGRNPHPDDREPDPKHFIGVLDPEITRFEPEDFLSYRDGCEWLDRRSSGMSTTLEAHEVIADLLSTVAHLADELGWATRPMPSRQPAAARPDDDLRLAILASLESPQSVAGIKLLVKAGLDRIRPIIVALADEGLIHQVDVTGKRGSSKAWVRTNRT